MIQVRGLEYTYAGAQETVLRGLEFEIGAGEIFGFLGPSGAGKSTTQNILIGLLKGYEGSVLVMGRELRDWPEDYYERIGVSFELPNHYLKLTGSENLRYFRSLYEGETEDPQNLLELVGLADSADLPVGQYSKGMKARLNFARSLLPRPEVLFLDEPTGGLDPGNARRVKDIILERRDRGTTIFLATHDMTVADQLCDRVALIDEGEITLVDAPESLKLRYGERVVVVGYQENGVDRERQFPLDGLGDNEEFLQILRSHDIRRIHSLETTLERVFLEVTGRELR